MSGPRKTEVNSEKKKKKRKKKDFSRKFSRERSSSGQKTRLSDKKQKM